MADKEHLARLQQGVEAWNTWRRWNPRIQPNLVGADLVRANLSDANLSRTNLSRAILTAILVDANLTGADLTGTDLAGAILKGTTFGDVDLSPVRGLQMVQHYGPSTIGIDTLYRSNGQIPQVFLQGTGVPEDFIPYIKSLVGHPFQFYSCFISYNHTDKSFARRLHDQLQGRGIRCWLDEHQMLPGDDIYEQIDRGASGSGTRCCCVAPRRP